MKDLTEAQVYMLRTLVEDELKRCRKLRKTNRKNLKIWAEMEIMTHKELLKILDEKYQCMKSGGIV